MWLYVSLLVRSGDGLSCLSEVVEGVERNRFFNLIVVFIIIHRNSFDSFVHDLDALVIIVEPLSEVVGGSVVRE